MVTPYEKKSIIYQTMKEAEEILGLEKVQQLKADLKEEPKEELRQDADFVISIVPYVAKHKPF